MTLATIIAIHGTFAPEAEWTRNGASLHRMLEKLSESPIAWHSFAWSGKNSHAERERAAVELAGVVRSVTSDAAKGGVYLLAHSHGGNVALMALCHDAALQRQVDGVICLSTPFVVAKPEDLDNLAEDVGGFKLGVVALGILLNIAIGDLLHHIFPVFMPVFFVAYVVAVAVALLTSFFLYQSLKNADRTGGMIRAYQFEKVRIPVLVMRTERDEALGWIRTISTAADTGIYASTTILTVGVLAYCLLYLSIALLPVFAGLAMAWSFFGPATAEQSSERSVIGTILMTSPYFAVLFLVTFPVFSLAARGVRALLRLGPWSWGESLASGVLVKFSAAKKPSAPTIEERVVKVPPEESGGKTTLRHSLLYSAPTAVRIISEFLVRQRAL